MAEVEKENEGQKAEEGKAVSVRREGEGRAMRPFDEMESAFEDFFPRRWRWGRMPTSLEEFDRMMDRMDRFMDELPPRGWWRGPDWRSLSRLAPFGGRTPRVDVIDRDEELVIEAELPGVNKEDLEVSMGQNAVTIAAKTSREEKEEKGDYYRREMSRGSFTRTVPLPVEVDGSRAKATFKDGIVRLVLPKTEPAKRRRIKVE